MAMIETVLPVVERVANITSKGQVTIPVEIRRIPGAKTGGKLVFDATRDGIRIVRQSTEDVLEQFRGIGNGIPELDGGRESINRYMREMRGHDVVDDLIFGTEG